MNNSEKQFLLSKWYIDLVDEKGDLLIIYSGRIKMGSMSIFYSSLLQKPADKKAVEAFTLKKQASPAVNGDLLSWKSEELKLDLEFRQAGRSIVKELIHLPEGFICWECFHTRSLGTVILGSGEEFTGLGYAERLDMTLMPWKLPFNELRWGRYLSDNNSVIWIDYKGEMNHSVVFFNNDEFPDAEFSENGLIFNSGSNELIFSGAEDIKNGEIISNRFSAIPGLRNIIPSFLRIFEHKLVSQGSLSLNGSPSDKGQAIFEVVKWM